MDKQELRKNRLMNEPMKTLIPAMAVPTIISFLITTIYNLADTYFVSFLGTNATAAVSVNASIDQVIMMVGSLFAIGANSYAARLIGAQQEKKASQVLSTAFFLAGVFGLLVLILGISFMKPLVHLLGATENCEQYAIDYATYVLLVAPFMACNFVMNQCLRAEGSAMLSMIGMSFGGILNCILDPIFIFNFDLGVAGASMATAISKLVSFAILIYPYLTKKSLLRLSAKLIHMSKDIISQIIMVGSSSFFRNVLALVAAVILNNLAGQISESVLAAIGVTNRVMMLPFGVVLGFGAGFQPVAGFNWGAKNYDRVQESYRFASRTAFLGSCLMAAVFIIFSKQLISLFTATDEELMRIGSYCIIVQSIALPVHAWCAVVNMYCAGLGFAKSAFIMATARQGSCFLPIVYPMAYIFGTMGIASVMAVADLLTIFLAIPIIRKAQRTVRAAALENSTAI